jgi:hypothetical protein
MGAPDSAVPIDNRAAVFAAVHGIWTHSVVAHPTEAGTGRTWPPIGLGSELPSRPNVRVKEFRVASCIPAFLRYPSSHGVVLRFARRIAMNVHASPTELPELKAFLGAFAVRFP